MPGLEPGICFRLAPDRRIKSGDDGLLSIPVSNGIRSSPRLRRSFICRCGRFRTSAIHRSRRTQMTKISRNLIAATCLAGFTALASTAASANGCPANRMGENALMNAPTKPAGVTDTVLEQIDLSKEMVKLNDHHFRIRRLEIQPGGIVPLHDHGDRPALIYIVSGEITEYASDCKT